MGAELDSVTVVASDMAASLLFYDAALGALGIARAVDFGDEEEDGADVEAAAWAAPSAAPMLWLVRGMPPTRAAHVTVRAQSRDDVERFFAAACAAGGAPQSAPRRWVIYRRGTVSAAVADPDGNTLEAVAPE